MNAQLCPEALGRPDVHLRASHVKECAFLWGLLRLVQGVHGRVLELCEPGAMLTTSKQ